MGTLRLDKNSFGKVTGLGNVGTWGRYLELQSWLGHCAERRGLPVGLLGLFPHDHIEAATVLVTEEEASVVVVRDCVHVESAFKVHTIKGRVSWSRNGLGVGGSRAGWQPVVGWVRVRRCPLHRGLVSPCESSHRPSVGAVPLGMTELGVLHIPTARPGSLFIV